VFAMRADPGRLINRDPLFDAEVNSPGNLN
jgi:hypothetical protein